MSADIFDCKNGEWGGVGETGRGGGKGCSWYLGARGQKLC